MKLSDKEFDKYQTNLIMYGTAFIMVSNIDSELVAKVLDNKEVIIKTEKPNANS